MIYEQILQKPNETINILEKIHKDVIPVMEYIIKNFSYSSRNLTTKYEGLQNIIVKNGELIVNSRSKPSMEVINFIEGVYQKEEIEDSSILGIDVDFKFNTLPKIKTIFSVGHTKLGTFYINLTVKNSKLFVVIGNKEFKIPDYNIFTTTLQKVKLLIHKSYFNISINGINLHKQELEENILENISNGKIVIGSTKKDEVEPFLINNLIITKINEFGAKSDLRVFSVSDKLR